jgi:hypothetical protein
MGSPFSADEDLDESYEIIEETKAAERHRRIQEAAYHRAEKRGFDPGHALEDWIAAEAEIDASTSTLGDWR